MAKSLDFNSLKKPTIDITLRDPDKTKLRVTTPRESLVERIATGLPELEQALRANDAGTLRAAWDLAAELMSCNLDGVTVTAEDLRGKYGLALDDLVIFCAAYVDFLTELKNAKN